MAKCKIRASHGSKTLCTSTSLLIYIYIYRLMPVTTFIFSCETDLLVFS